MSALGFGLAMGGLDFLSNLNSQRQQNKDARSWRHKTRGYRNAMNQGIQATKESLDYVPTMAAGLRQQAQSEAAIRQQRLNQSLAQRGMTSGGAAYNRAQGDLVSGLNMSRTGVEINAAKLKAALAGQLGQMGAQGLGMSGPQPERTYVNPMSSVITGIAAGSMAKDLFPGGKTGGVGADGMTDFIRRPGETGAMPSWMLPNKSQGSELGYEFLSNSLSGNKQSWDDLDYMGRPKYMSSMGRPYNYR